MKFQRVTRSSVSDAVFEQLSDQILDGDLPVGSSLPAERLLTDALGVNRQAVREALKRLSQAGLVRVRHGETTRVRDYRQGAGLDLLPRLLIRGDGAIDPAVARSIMEMRATIGPDVACSCAERATSSQALAIAEAAERMAGTDPDDLAGLAALDLDFWDALVEGSDNIAYRLALNSLRRVVQAGGPVLHALLADELRDHAAHQAIAAAVTSGDGAAAAAAAAALLGTGTAAINALLVELPAPGDG